MAYLSREATLLYFILCAVADKHGHVVLRRWHDWPSCCTYRCRPWSLARDELLARDLIAHEARFTQVLSLLPPLASGVARSQAEG